MTAKAKGSRNELKTVRWLEKQGYKCCKSGGSLGEWDIIAIGQDDVLLVQVKSNTWPPPKERGDMERFVCPQGCIKVLHRWDDYARAPREIFGFEGAKVWTSVQKGESSSFPFQKEE